MKAIIIKQVGELEYVDLPEPIPGPGQVLIKTRAAALHFADIMLRQGRFPNTVRSPFITGWDLAGTVAGLGPGVTGLAPGQPVLAFADIGTHAEYSVAAAHEVYPVPEGVDLEEAAAILDTGTTAINLLTLAGRLEPGEHLLVHAAAGGVGSLVVQVARLLGAGQVIGTVSSEEKAAVARQMGYDHVVNYRTEDFPQRVRELTAGSGADLILDSVGGEVFQQSLTCLATFGRLVNYGIASGVAGQVKTDLLEENNQAVIGYNNDQFRPLRPRVVAEGVARVLAYFQEGRLRPLITGRYPFEKASAAFDLVESRQTTGRIILVP